MSWPDLTEWWLAEIVDNPAYEEVVTPMLLQILQPQPRRTYLDLGAGEGRVMASVARMGAGVSGVDINRELAQKATSFGAVVIGRLPNLGFIRDDSYDGVFSVLVIEHLDDHEELFREAGRVVKPGGVFALVMNHPTWTAPGSTPITDLDGETLWRPGGYFSRGTTEEPAGERRVLFHHRNMADLLNAAADSRWSLEAMIEAPHHELPDQGGIPRLLACRWQLLP